MTFRIFAFALGLLLIGSAGGLKAGIDFSDYNVPLGEQVIDRIKDGISRRLGDGPNKRERYFMIPFAYENRGNDPEFSHSFITVIRVFPDRGRTWFTQGLRRGKHRQWEFEAFNISWLPHDFLENPNLCVFRGPFSRIFPRANTCPLSPGKSFSLEETLQLGAQAKNTVVMWGPYEIDRKAFELGVRRKELLDTGTIRYRADDRLYREDKIAINCFHAIAGLDELYPNGGLFGTGFKMWGINGTARVLLEYTKKEHFRKLILEPVDIKRDRFGFVYAPTRGERGVYHPVKHASAYRR